MKIKNLVRNINYFFDRLYVSLMYVLFFSRKLNWKHPTRYTEKIQIFKISNEAESLSSFVDKYEVRKYVEKTVGTQYLVPILGVFDDVSQIDLKALPRQFVLKTTHGSGWNVICKDKNKVDWNKEFSNLSLWMKKNYYNSPGRERQYKNIKPKIICEKYIFEGKEGLIDYKIYCFSGKPYCIRAMVGRYTHLRKSTYDLDWKPYPLNFIFNPPIPLAHIPKPKNLQKMIRIAAKLSAPFPEVRVDLYNVDGQIYFGELTFTPSGGLERFDPDSCDEMFGSFFNL
ncbi:MAG TPA: ATP-grasp fold amidoligase family protein [Patescibacteria group bacterium]|nr:ATP-grasp fold amidoligase family protein [Patescibacteria group bacterium]